MSSVPRFHFHIVDGTALTDTDGLELPDTAAAKSEAIRLAGAVLKDYIGDDLWRGEPWQIVVNDSQVPNTGRTYFNLTLTATE
ncbi:hypothetical protein [Bradyrhizobium sp. URHA0013]|uniref:DUF6894 family protein n=1 Tax=Bradyrhizobium sp. URHA0013 TaxID=1380352 RepID=UPI003528AAA7